MRLNIGNLVATGRSGFPTIVLDTLARKFY